jgi:aldose 1-epimerase
MKITSSDFGITSKGEKSKLFTLGNANGMTASISNYGGTIQSIILPTEDGPVDVILGFDSVIGYEENAGSCFGALVGPVANRISNASFELNDETYPVEQNFGDHCLHSGSINFSHRVLLAETLILDDEVRLILFITSPHGEGGLPGKLNTRVTYALTNANELRIDYHAVCDRDAILNLTNHAYFNLAGSGSALDHEVKIHSSQVLEISDWGIPTGELRNIAGTPLDFTSSKRVGAQLKDDYDLLKFGCGYDHCYVLHKDGQRRHVATLTEPNSGRSMEIHTTEPGLQLYSGNHIGETFGKGITLRSHDGICLETQQYPDAINHSNFPSPILKAGEAYESSTVHHLKF